MDNINVLYEDNHLLVVVKPAGIPSQSDISGDTDMLTLLKDYIKVKYNKPGNVYLGLVHRLDRPVSGVMVFARTSKAAARLTEQIKKGTFKKLYHLVCEGKPSGGRLEHYLRKDFKTNIVKSVPQGTNGGKFAMLDYKVLETQNNKSLCEVDLITGRSHQIRVQFASIGHPLVNDMKYNKNAKPGHWISLYSHSITLMHPTKKEQMTFTAPFMDLFVDRISK